MKQFANTMLNEKTGYSTKKGKPNRGNNKFVNAQDWGTNGLREGQPDA